MKHSTSSSSTVVVVDVVDAVIVAVVVVVAVVDVVDVVDVVAVVVVVVVVDAELLEVPAYVAQLPVLLRLDPLSKYIPTSSVELHFRKHKHFGALYVSHLFPDSSLQKETNEETSSSSYQS